MSLQNYRTMETKIEDRIIRILHHHNGIKAKGIAKALGIERSEVNAILYRLKGKGKCIVDDNYLWKMVSPASQPVHSASVTNKSGLLSKTEIYKSQENNAIKNNKIVPPIQKQQTKTRMKEPRQTLYRPASSNANDLFEYAVKHLAEKSQQRSDIFEPKMHNQWYNYCFDYRGISSSMRSEYMSLIKSEYKAYFIGKLKYTFDIKSIERDFPQFFKGYEIENQNIETEILRAVRSELEFARKPQNKEKYIVSCIESEKNAPNIYRLTLDLRDDDEPHFYEGIKIKLLVNKLFYDCIGINYDIATAVLSISSDRKLPTGNQVYGLITLDTTFILEAVLGMIMNMNQIHLESFPINKFIEDSTDHLLTTRKDAFLYVSQYGTILDNSQKEAFEASINHDITFIWGPPGTGKSFTLASIIRTLFALSESTIVCCISNVAVDQLLNKVVDVLGTGNDAPKPGNFYRAGYTIDQRLLATNYLFPEDEKTKLLRDRITTINRKLEKLKSHGKRDDNSEELVLKNERIEKRDELKSHTEFLVNSSKIVFSTIAGFILDKKLHERPFDNLIVDEASMLSMPYLFAIAQKVFKRIILVGDPQQLGPISITPNKWLRKNVFDYCKVLTQPHPALKQLLNQRRSHPKIVRLTNDVFYEGRLNAMQDKCPKWVEQDPFAGKIVAVLNPKTEDNTVKYVGSTRRNFGTKKAVIEILEKYYNLSDKSFSIGIITPYRGQVKMYLGAIQDRYSGDGFWERIKVGTIHTFQGSECDLILLDLVEKSPIPVGKLFDGVDGERLINVALSRAKHKLIIVGDTKRFGGGSGIANVSIKVSKALSRLI